MTEMVERVAHAILAEVRKFSAGVRLDEIDRAMARDFARAAIAAMREPTDAMVEKITIDHDTQGVVYVALGDVSRETENP